MKILGKKVNSENIFGKILGKYFGNLDIGNKLVKECFTYSFVMWQQRRVKILYDVKYYDYRKCLYISFLHYYFTSLFPKSRLVLS